MMHASNNSYTNNSFINNNNDNENNNNNNNNKDSALFFLNSLNEPLDVKFNEFFNKHASLPAGDAYLLKNLYGKLTSLESQVKHQGFLLGHMNLELSELRKTNAEQFKKVVTLRSRVACSESVNSNFNVNNSLGEFWNELLNRIRDIHSLGGFKSALSKYFFDNDSLQPSH